MVGGSRIGYLSTPLEVNGKPISFGPATGELINGSMTFNQARAAGVLKLDTTDQGVPTVRNMVLAMDGKTIDGHLVNTVVKQLNDKGEEQNVSTVPVFTGLGLAEQVMHTVASPPMAFLLFIIGLALLIFEFFTAGVGIAGGVGAVCVVLGCYGLSALPTRPAAVALLVLSLLAFAIDVQVGIPRAWTGVGIVLFIISAWYLYEPVPGNDLRLGWITLVVAVGGVMLTFIVGMPSMVRTRFATPTIGREWMIGHEGSATTAINPEGVAMVSGARWRARTNRATPISAGAGLRVVAIDGVTLEVEPEEGAARDYRERRAKQ
jgi:membrane-bound serine protease (ClpP class)